MDGEADEGLVDTFRHAKIRKQQIVSHGLITAQKVLTIIAVCASTCFASQPLAECCVETASTMKFAAWKNRPITPPVWATFRR